MKYDDYLAYFKRRKSSALFHFWSQNMQTCRFRLVLNRCATFAKKITHTHNVIYKWKSLNTTDKKRMQESGKEDDVMYIYDRDEKEEEKHVNIEYAVTRWCVCVCAVAYCSLLFWTDSSTKQRCLTSTCTHTQKHKVTCVCVCVCVCACSHWKSYFVINESSHFAQQKGSKVLVCLCYFGGPAKNANKFSTF